MKKVLSYVLVLALVLSSFSMAFAGSSTELKSLSDIAGNFNEEAIEVNYDLGIITGNPDGTFQPTKAVTRAEFAAMLTRALAIPDSALAAYSTTSFKDAAGYTWAVPYLAFCNSKGIMLGDGAGNAMPGKTITVNEAVTMALRAIGYTANSAELVGVWPSNYVTKAQELDLYDDVAKDASGVDKANAAQIIYNLLGVQKVAVNSDGETKKLWDKEPNATKDIDGVPTTLLSSGLNCTTDGDAVVDRSDCDDSLINMAKHIGKYGSIYRNSDDEVVAFIDNGDLLTGRFFVDGSAVKFKTTDAEKEYTITNSKDTTIAALLLNGDNVGGGNSITIAAIDFGNGDKEDLSLDSVANPEFTLSVDLSGSTIKEIYGVTDWNVSSADTIDAADISDIKDDQSLLSTDFTLDDEDNIDYTQFNLVGVNSLSDIKADNVIYVYQDSDKEIVKIEVGTQKAEGVVKNFKDAKEDVATKFAIGANTYKNAADVLNGEADGGTAISEGDVSDNVTAFLDARGYVYDFENTTKADNYAVVEKIGTTGIDDQVKVMLSDGTEKTLSYDIDAEDGGPTLGAVSVIGYGLDSSGQITEANQLFVTTTSIKLSSKSVVSEVNGASVMGESQFAARGGVLADIADGVKIDSDCVVFTYDGSDYDVTTIDKVEVDDVISGAVLLFDENNDKSVDDDYTVVAMLIPDTMANGGDKSYAVLNEKNADSNDDSDDVWHVIGYKDGAKLDALTDDKDDFKGSYVAPVYKVGSGFVKGIALYEVKVDASGVVTSGKLVDSTDTTKKVHYVGGTNGGFTVGSADSRSSVTNKDNNNKRYALSDKVVVYQVTKDNEYKLFTGNLKSGDFVRLYETDDDEDGYDVVIMARPSNL
ncbi:S-layer homology domain-containing protein [Aminipila luticellarii]|uniref:S-layer homology domain-containing protein n=1 Tax=Aminipila luticellarii TaxID=2507160 RepID=A0A410PSJ8_9FIRM|nr:S-layer homology domain-containing protein [Aminipila luticellarii]QAT41894.1 S-layer homology domain-containing protein [Aminipila luticellarii]